MSSPKKQPVVEDIVSVFQTTQNQSWSIFSQKLNNVSSKGLMKKDPAKSENTITLSSDDIPVFGLVPRLDKVLLVSCNECAMIVKRDCIHSHFYRRHNSSNVSHSEADKFSLVNFLCTVKTNKNKKLKMTVRKPPEKKINERQKVDTVVKEIKTEFDQVEYERLLKTNRSKIKQENTIEYDDHHDDEMATTSCNPRTSSGVFDWDVKPCIQSLALDQCTDHKINDKTVEHNTDSNKLSSVSLDNKEGLQSNKYLKIQNINDAVNYVTSSSELMKLDPTEKMKPKLTLNHSNIAIGNQANYFKNHHTYTNKFNKFPFKIKKVKEETKLTIKNEYSEIINKANYEDILASQNQSSNTSAVDVKLKYLKLFSGLQNDHKHTKLKRKHLEIKSEMPMDSATSFNQSAKLPKIKEEYQITPIKMYPDVKIKEEYDENNDKCKVEFYQPPTELTKCSPENNHSEVISKTYSGNVDSNLSSTSPCSVVRFKEEITFTESSENKMNNKSSGDTVICSNQSSIALLDIKEESKYSLITDPIKEESKSSLTTENINKVSKLSLINTNEESKPSLNIDSINEKSKYPLITDYITDNSYTKNYQLYINSVPQLSPSYKCLDDELNFQIKKNFNNQLNLKVENDLNNKLNFPGEDQLNDKLNFQREDSLSDKLNLQVKEDFIYELNLFVEKDLNDKINLQVVDEISWQSIEDELKSLREEDLNIESNLQDEDESSIDLDYQDEDDVSDELNSQNENELDNGLNFQDEEDLNVELHLQSEENLSIEEDLSNVEDVSDGEDLNDEEKFSDKDNLNNDDIGTNNNSKYNGLVPSQFLNNDEETKLIPSKESSVIKNNESFNVSFTGHDQSPTETQGNEKESKAKSKIDDDFVIIGNDGVVNNFENEYYQYEHEVLTSFTPNYKHSDVINSNSSDNSNESLSSYDQSSVESLDSSEKTNYLSTDTSDYMSDEILYDSQSTTSSSDQSTTLHDITKKTKYTQTSLLEQHEQFMDRIDILTKSFDCVDNKNKCTQTNAPLECMNCYDSTDDYVNRHSTQIDENSVPNSNVQVDGYGINNFTPISSSAQIINNKIIPMEVEEYELKDSNDSDFNVSNKSHYSSHFQPYSCDPASQNNNLVHSPVSENNCIFDDELNAYKPNEYITIDEAIPFINKNNEMYKEILKIVDKKSVNDKKCKIMPFVRIAKNFKKNLKRQVADNKENRNYLISRGIKKLKFEFIDRDFSCSDESNNNDNVDD